MKIARPALFSVIAFLLVSGGAVGAQEPLMPESPPIEEIGEKLYRVGNITVDLASKEAVVAGIVNAVTILEFIATTKGGFKSYESSIELNTDAISFNLAMVLRNVSTSLRHLPSEFKLP